MRLLPRKTAVRPVLLTVVFTCVIAGCAISPPRYSVNGSRDLTFEEAATALLKNFDPGDGARGLDQPTRLIHAVPSSYPSEARRARIEGRVIVEFEIDELGNVARTRVIEEPHKLLADAAVSAVKQWKFRPHTYGGAPVKVRLRQPFAFKLDPPEDPSTWLSKHALPPAGP